MFLGNLFFNIIAHETDRDAFAVYGGHNRVSKTN